MVPPANTERKKRSRTITKITGTAGRNIHTKVSTYKRTRPVKRAKKNATSGAPTPLVEKQDHDVSGPIEYDTQLHDDSEYIQGCLSLTR